MTNEFQAVLYAHSSRYPLMEPQDYMKLAYQSEFGPEHIISAPKDVLPALREEWHRALPNVPARGPEPIGNSLCRFHLDNHFDPSQASPLLADLCYRTANGHHGTREGLIERLELLKQLDIGNIDTLLTDYMIWGCPPVHHSPVFRISYHPHYRLLKNSYAVWFPVLMAIWSFSQSGRQSLIAIDGCCGSGKTELAKTINEVFECRVFHMDDFYLPKEQRRDDWMRIPGGNIDLARFRTEVLIPARTNRAVTLHPFDCKRGRHLPGRVVPPASLTVVEGSYSLHPYLTDAYDLKIFLTCSPSEQERRLRVREGVGFLSFKDCWIPLEAQYMVAYGVEACSDLVLDTSDFFPDRNAL